MATSSVDDIGRSFERHLRAERKSPRTVKTYDVKPTQRNRSSEPDRRRVPHIGALTVPSMKLSTKESNVGISIYLGLIVAGGVKLVGGRGF
jgi:hypothetical protein